MPYVVGKQRDGDDGRFIEFNRNLSGLRFHYRNTHFTIAEISSALELAYEYGAHSPRAYAKTIIEADYETYH